MTVREFYELCKKKNMLDAKFTIGFSAEEYSREKEVEESDIEFYASKYCPEDKEVSIGIDYH